MRKALVWCLLPLLVLGQNMLRNAGFEDKDGETKLLHWQTHCTGGSTAGATAGQPYAGISCGYIVKIADGTSHVSALNQNVKAEPNTMYLLTAMARGQGKLFAYEYDGQGKWLRGTDGVNVNSVDWTPIFVNFTTTKDTRKLNVRFELYGKETEGRGWIDDVRLGQSVPRPSQPENFQAVYDREGKTVKLSWEPVAGLRYYVVRSRYPDIVSGMSEAREVAGGVFEDHDLPADWSRAFYQVMAADDWNQVSEPTAAREVRLLAPGKGGRIRLWTDSVMNKYRRYGAPLVEQDKPSLSISLAIRETEAKQIVVYAEQAPIEGLDVVCSELKDANGAVAQRLELRLLQVCYTMVRKTTCDPTLKLLPGLYPDALPPWRGAVGVPLEATQSIWVQAEAKAGCKPGTYTGNVKVTDKNGFRSVLPLTVEVYDFELPVTPTFKSAFAVWPSGIEKGFDVKSGTPEWQELRDKYYWFMADRRLGAGTLPYPVRSEKAKAFLDDPRVAAFQIPSGWGDKLNLEALKADTEYLREHGWLDKGYVYCFDEPNESQYDKVVELAKKVHSLGKDVQFIMTEQPEKKLLDHIDIWCPVLSAINWERLIERRQAGQHLWWYTCCSPKAPYPTYLIDDCGVSHRVLSWLQAKYNIEGVLYWCVDVYTMYRDGVYQADCKVWKEAELFPNANGDGFLTYPGKPVGVNGPVTCIRMEILRDGNEDVEYFNLYRSLLGDDSERLVQEAVAPVATDLTHWNHDPQALETRRDWLARRIISLKK